ncbi:methyl-accepting chemotaxis sensory transducer [Desulfonatronospira thiodismutans ASO3-1]|uniref:Methyl-accepting chemotaxis sensory transducer n=1 Tax=Desulfonatronospira thiodismutans ASO3-1 TaxID=555779 RepID=D6SMK0_9BACT|nr:methyl-accepting chemotaxis sensory transducer [Desulfonatronospira thiodismutans ASO3-1]RQD76944.1 MAG: methyl-accepting chemotaxis protein [Desulfonatronospira sp. MSAO_Bac3]
MNFFRNLRLSFKVFIPLTIILIVFIGVLFWVLNDQTQKVSDEFISQISKNKRAEIESSVDLTIQEAQSVASTFSRLPEVIQAYNLALEGNINDPESPESQEAREMLREKLSAQMEGYQEFSDQQLTLHFHLPNGRSLVRLWRDHNAMQDGEWVDISDDISEFRATVMHVNQQQEPAQGIEVGRGGFTLRNVLPVSDQNSDHLGSVELLMDFEPIVEAAGAAAGEEVMIYMNRELLDIATGLQDESQFPLIDNRYVEAIGDSRYSDLITADLLDMGREELSLVQEGHYALSFFPIKDYAGNQVGVTAYILDISDEQGMISQMTQILMGVTAGLLVILLLVVRFVMGWAVLSPFSKGVGFAQQISQGDLTQRLDIKQRDEVGILADALNDMADSLRNMFGDINSGVETLASSSTELNAISEDMSQRSETTASKVQGVASAAEELSTSMSSIASAMEQASSKVNTVATSSEEMGATISEIAQNTENAKDITGNAVEKSRQSSQRIDRLGNAAQEISKVTDTITAISSQTNLLALNATIEAARAGEAGKGFAVVANEIKELAQQTAQATEEIRDKVENIQSETSLTVEEIQEISQIISDIDSIISTIAASVEEQNIATQEIAENVSQASQGNQQVNENVSQVSSVAEDVARDISEVNMDTEEMKSSGVQVKQSSEELSRLAERLKELVSKFKV